MNRRAVYWAGGCAVLGAVMLALGIRAAVVFQAPRQDETQVLTLGQFVDLIVGALLLVIAVLITLGQVRAHRRRTHHQRWIREHRNDV